MADKEDWNAKEGSLLWGLFMAAFRLVWRFTRRWLRRLALTALALIVLFVVAFALFNPPTTLYMASENARLDGIQHEWTSIGDIAPVMLRSVVAAEDANFCAHWGFDIAAIRMVIEEGGHRGASTITQQTVKNVYLWPARSWPRKALEALITPVVELVWSKRRILEVYLNVIEFSEGVFGIGAAAWDHFGVAPADLSPEQAALLAATLPNPKERIASNPSAFMRRRAASIADGAETIRSDGRSDCFKD